MGALPPNPRPPGAAAAGAFPALAGGEETPKCPSPLDELITQPERMGRAGFGD